MGTSRAQLMIWAKKLSMWFCVNYTFLSLHAKVEESKQIPGLEIIPNDWMIFQLCHTDYLCELIKGMKWNKTKWKKSLHDSRVQGLFMSFQATRVCFSMQTHIKTASKE